MFWYFQLHNQSLQQKSALIINFIYLCNYVFPNQREEEKIFPLKLLKAKSFSNFHHNNVRSKKKVMRKQKTKEDNRIMRSAEKEILNDIDDFSTHRAYYEPTQCYAMKNRYRYLAQQVCRLSAIQNGSSSANNTTSGCFTLEKVPKIYRLRLILPLNPI